MSTRRILLCRLTCLFAAVTSDIALAEDKPETPLMLAGVRVIDVTEANRLRVAGQARFIDTRSPLNFGKARVPGAVAASYREKSEYRVDFDAAVDQFDMARLGPNKSQLIVIYSDGPTGWKSYKAATLAVRAGYRQVHYMRSGWAAWAAARLPIER